MIPDKSSSATVTVDIITANYTQILILEIQNIYNIRSDARFKVPSYIVYLKCASNTSCVHLKSEFTNIRVCEYKKFWMFLIQILSFTIVSCQLIPSNNLQHVSFLMPLTMKEIVNQNFQLDVIPILKSYLRLCKD